MFTAALVLVLAAAAAVAEGSEDTYYEPHISFLKRCPENFTDYDKHADFYKVSHISLSRSLLRCRFSVF
ncbi:hypothetical protein J6590_036167 [Homalodisca vitripennis]|nr:hypothetical protein J6590_036167 [Homalodisca vitripennis]